VNGKESVVKINLERTFSVSQREMNGEGSMRRNDIKAENMHFQKEGKREISQSLRVCVARTGVFASAVCVLSRARCVRVRGCVRVRVRVCVRIHVRLSVCTHCMH
jgi:hypothetical protein